MRKLFLKVELFFVIDISNLKNINVIQYSLDNVLLTYILLIGEECVHEEKERDKKKKYT